MTAAELNLLFVVFLVVCLYIVNNSVNMAAFIIC